MPDSPTTAKFLDEEDKLVAIERYLTQLALVIVAATNQYPDCA